MANTIFILPKKNSWFYLSGDSLNARKLVDEISVVYEERLKLISNFDSTRQIELEERIMDEVNGYRRILF